MLTILNLKNKKMEHYDYEDIYEGMREEDRNHFLKHLYQRNKAGEIHAYCTCVPDKKIPLIVSKRNDTYYVKRQDASVQHSPSCKFDGEYIHSIKGWDVQPDGTINVSLRDRMYSINSFSNLNLHCSQLSLEEFVVRYMGYVWELQSRYFLKNNKGSVTYSDFSLGLQYWASKIKFSERISLKDVLGNTKGKSYTLLKENLRMLIIMQFEKKEKLDKKTYLIYLKNPGMEYSVEVTCSIELWNSTLSALELQKAPLMIAGFVELLKDKPLNFLNLAIIPISNEGVVVNNDYEKKLINALHKKKRAFVNSSETFRVFEYTKPNVILIDSNPMTIVEIFEKPKSDVEYYKKKQKKIEYFTSLNNFKMVIWDAYNNDPLFKF